MGRSFALSSCLSGAAVARFSARGVVQQIPIVRRLHELASFRRRNQFTIAFTVVLVWSQIAVAASAPSSSASEFNQGVALLNGTGVEKDERAALLHLRRAADAGNPQAQDIAGELLNEGTHPSESRSKSLQLEMQGIVSNYRQGQVDLANVQKLTSLSKELAAIRDPDAAIDYFKKAITAGLPSASRHLADLLLVGDGVARDLPGARAQYEVAASRGDAIAANVLAAMRETGLGGPVDLPGAELAYSAAARGGVQRATLASGGFGAARDWLREQTLLDALATPSMSSTIRPEFVGSGRKLVMLTSAVVSIRDAAGRRRFHGNLEPGNDLGLAKDDALIDFVASTPTLRPDLEPDTTFGRLYRPGGSETIKGRFHLTYRLISDVTGRAWVVSPRGCDVRVFTADGELSLPSRFVPLQTTPGDIGPIEAPEIPGLYLELRPSCTADVTSPDGSRWTAASPQGVTIRTRMTAGPHKNLLPVIPSLQSLPAELGAPPETGEVVSRDDSGAPDAWAFRADDYRQAGVISTWVLNLAVKALQTSMTGDPASALRSTTIYHTANLQIYGPHSTDALNSGISLARALANAGRTNEAMSQADYWSSLGERMFGPRHESVAAAHLLRASVESAAGELPLAEVDARRAIVATSLLQPDTPLLGDKAAWKQMLGTVLSRPSGNVDPRYVTALTLLADLYAAAGETTRERAVLRRLLVLETINDPEGRGNGLIPVLIRLARLSSTTDSGWSRSLADFAGRLAKADAFLRDVPEPLPSPLPPVAPFFQKIFGDPTKSIVYANALRELGDAYLVRNDNRDAATVLQAAASIASNSAGPESAELARIDELRAEQALQSGDIDDALKLARASYNTDIRIRNESISVDGSVALAVGARESTDLLLRALAMNGPSANNVADAYEVVSQALSADLGQAVTLSSRPEAAATAAQLAAARRDLQTAITKNEEASSAQLRQRVEVLSAQLSSLVPLRTGVTLPELANRLGHDGALVVLWPGRTDTFVLAIGPGGRKLAIAEGGTEALRGLVARYRSQLTDLTAPFDTDASASIYRRLFKPIEPQLAGAKRLLVISDGFLRSVPLEALRKADHWLADDFQVDYLPGFAETVASAARRTNRPPLFAVANPIVPGGSTQDTPLARFFKWIWRDKLVPLPETESEIESIRYQLSGDPADLLVREKATEDQIRAHPDFRTAKVVVFATHGLAAGDALEPDGLPSLLLSPSSNGKRFLSSADIERLKIQADLVVLSACDTAAPDGSLGSAGLSGLARAFLQAGARAIVATHWRVRSDAAQAFSISIIKNWRQGLTLLSAKATAQKELRTTPGFEHPGLWASFVLLGAGETKWN